MRVAALDRLEASAVNGVFRKPPPARENSS
jgi:hypothetical protein